MSFHGWTMEALDRAGAHWTAREIAQQPELWAALPALVGGPQGATARFLAPLLSRPGLRIVLTGAGSSAFVGQCLAPALAKATGLRVDAVATTDLVSAPGLWLRRDEPTLLVSFARSGNSPESLAAVEVAGQVLDEVHHLVITCSAEGALFRRASAMPQAHALLLPDACNDRSFAMTSSFTAMLRSAALAFGIPLGDASAPAQAVLRNPDRLAHELATRGFERVIYLGANALQGVAREAALKLLELTDGRVVAMAETPLGFRHGPKTIVNARTLVVVFLSQDAHSRRYDLDLLAELRRDGVAGRVIALSGGPAAGGEPDVVVAGAEPQTDLDAAFPMIVFAQCLALQQSLALGVRPDQPNPAGVVNRVVQGVTIYPLASA